MVGRAEGPLGQQGMVLRRQAHDGVDLRGLQRLPPGHGRQNGRQTPGQHALTGAGRADHGGVVPPGGGDLQHPLHLLLAPHFGEIRHGQVLPLLAPGGRGGDLLPAGEMLGQLLHVLHRVDGEAFGQGRLRGAVRGDEEPLDPRRLSRQGHGQHPDHGAQGPGEGQLPHKGAVRVAPIQLAGGGQNAHEDGQVVDRAGLAQVGRGQVHRDPPHGEGVAVVLNGRAHPFPRLLHGGVGQTHDVKVGQPTGQVALSADLVAINTL